jgi:hypothetical protein
MIMEDRYPDIAKERVVEILQAYVAAEARLGLRSLIAERLKSVMTAEEINALGLAEYTWINVETFHMLAITPDSLPVYQNVYDSIVHSSYWNGPASFTVLTEENCAEAMKEAVSIAHQVNRVTQTEDAFIMEVSALDHVNPALLDFADGCLMPVLQ